MAAWCGWGSAAPIVYDYGNNVTYQGDQVYYGDQPVATADQYYQQASDIAQSARRPLPIRRATIGFRSGSSRSSKAINPTRTQCSSWQSIRRA